MKNTLKKYCIARYAIPFCICIVLIYGTMMNIFNPSSSYSGGESSFLFSMKFSYQWIFYSKYSTFTFVYRILFLNNLIEKYVKLQPTDQRDTVQSLMPAFNITAKFVTLHLAPVRRCKVSIVIDGASYLKEPDTNGIVYETGFFTRKILEEKVEVSIKIESGTGENMLINTYTWPLMRDPKNKQLYAFNNQFIFQPVNPQPTHIIGRVVDQLGNPIFKAPLLISYEYPVFQDEITFYTDENGSFDAVANLDQLIPIFGNIIIDNNPYEDWNMMRDTEYKDGFFIMNHLEFRFDKDISLKLGLVVINISGQVTDRQHHPLAQTQISIECISTTDPLHHKTFTLEPTGIDGKFQMKDKTEFHPEDKITCEVSAMPSDLNLQPAKVTVVLTREKTYKVEPLKIVLSTLPIKGQIVGKVVSELTSSPLLGVDVNYNITSSDYIDVLAVKTSQSGEFKLIINAFKQETYSGEVKFSSPAFEELAIPLTLDGQIFYSADVGIVKLKYKPQPVEILITALVVEKTLQTIIPDLQFNISLTKADQKDHFENIKTDKDGKLQFSLKAVSTDSYKLVLNIKGDIRFQDTEIKKSFGPTTNFDGNLGTISIPRRQMPGSISGSLTDSDSNSPIKNASLQVLTDVKMPQQEMSCLSNSKGLFDCKFLVEKMLTYQSSLQVLTEFGQLGKINAGELSMDNFYTIKNLNSFIKFEIISKEGLISGHVQSAETSLPIADATYRIISVVPPIENIGTIINKDINCGPGGEFKIQLNLRVGPSYDIVVEFFAPHMVSGKETFKLNFHNKYTIEDYIVTLGKPLQGSISGHVRSKLYFIIEGAQVSIEISQKTFSTLTDKTGFYFLNVPAVSTEEEEKGLITVSKQRFKTLKTSVVFQKSAKFIIQNYDITLEGEGWKSKVSGKIIDEMKKPVPFCSLSLVLKDSFKNPTTSFPYTTVSDQDGGFSFTIEISFNDVFVGHLSIQGTYFVDRLELFELNNQNQYIIENKIIQLERLKASLSYAGSLLDSLRKAIPGLSIALSFDEEAHTHGVRDMILRETESKFRFEQKVLMGYAYKAKAKFMAHLSKGDNAVYTEVLDEEFNIKNNYKIENIIVIIKRKMVECLVSGTILDEATGDPMKGAQAILVFLQKEFSKLTKSTISDEEGKFSITQHIQEGYIYPVKVLGKFLDYRDGGVEVSLSYQNIYKVTDLKIILKKAEEGYFFMGHIRGHTLSIFGEILNDSLVTAIMEDDPSKKYDTKSNERGEFAIENLKFVRGNKYFANVELTPNDPNFNKKKRRICLSPDDDYQYNNLTLAADRIRVTYSIKGTITDQMTNIPLGGTQVVVSFLNSLMIENSYSYTNNSGQFALTGKVAKGIDYEGQFTITHAGYKTITPSFPFKYIQNPDPPIEHYSKNDANYALLKNPFQKVYYLDRINTVAIHSRVFELTSCPIFPHKYLPFVKVSLFLENGEDSNDILIAVTYTDIHGNFQINSPRPLFSELLTLLVFERSGYMQLNVYQRIGSRHYDLQLGPVQIDNKTGVQSCSKKQKKIQDKYDANH